MSYKENAPPLTESENMKQGGVATSLKRVTSLIS